jgi:hypothetical protein
MQGRRRRVIHVLGTLLLAIAMLFFTTLLLGLFGLIGMELHWVVRIWGQHPPHDEP